MVNEGSNMSECRKPRFLCLHGFRTSGEILKKQLVRKWASSVVEKLDLVFVDGPFPCQGKSDVAGMFEPPYYEWFQFNQIVIAINLDQFENGHLVTIEARDLTEYTNFHECLAYIEVCMMKYGPFDGVLGFSQGAVLSGALPGLQSKGLALTKVDKIKFLIVIAGGKSRDPPVAENAYTSKNQCPSIHFLGEKDYLREDAIKLLESYVDPVVIRHSKGHTIPRFDDEKSLEMMHGFIERIQKQLTETDEQKLFPENANGLSLNRPFLNASI